MGYLSYYTYGLPTFTVIVVALYLLFTGMSLHSLFGCWTHSDNILPVLIFVSTYSQFRPNEYNTLFWFKTLLFSFK